MAAEFVANMSTWLPCGPLDARWCEFLLVPVETGKAPVASTVKATVKATVGACR